MTEFNMRGWLRGGRLDLRVLNSLTKYPSIPTLHALDRGALTDGLAVDLTGDVTITEKINGTNARMIVLPDGEVIVGSREELLYAAGDTIANPALGIVETLHPRWTTPAHDRLRGFDSIYVVYGEVYGSGISGGREYLDPGESGTGFRVFDACRVPLDMLLLDGPDRAAEWREAGGQDYADEVVLDAWCRHLGAPRVPVLGHVAASTLPATVEDAAAWLDEFTPRTRAPLGSRADGRAEGVVIRACKCDAGGQHRLAKLRREDVDRTLRRRASRRELEVKS